MYSILDCVLDRNQPNQPYGFASMASSGRKCSPRYSSESTAAPIRTNSTDSPSLWASHRTWQHDMAPSQPISRPESVACSVSGSVTGSASNSRPQSPRRLASLVDRMHLQEPPAGPPMTAAAMNLLKPPQSSDGNLQPSILQRSHAASRLANLDQARM